MPRPKPTLRAPQQAERRGGLLRRRAADLAEDGRRNRRIPAGLWLLVAAAIAVPAPFVALHGLDSVRAQRVLDDGDICTDTGSPTAVAAECLTPVTGELRGPFWTRRDPGHEWSVWVDGQKYDEFDLGGSWDEEVGAYRDRATVLTRRGDVVAVRVPTAGEDRVVPVRGIGGPGAAQAFLLDTMCVGGVIGASSFGWRRRKAAGSWLWVGTAAFVMPLSPRWFPFLRRKDGTGRHAAAGPVDDGWGGRRVDAGPDA